MSAPTMPTKAPTWYDHLPKPQSQPQDLTVSELKAIMEDEKKERGMDYIVVDVRRADMDEAPGNTMHPAAINLPAQAFYQTLPVTFQLLSKIPMVIFHCSSSQGRGPRCAGWYQDMLNEKQVTGSKAFVLKGGIKAWGAEYPEEVVML